MIINISVAIIAAFVVILVICLIPVLFQVRRTARQAELTLESVRHHLAPISHDVTVITQRIQAILGSIQHQVETVEEGVSTLRETASDLQQFERRVVHLLEEPLIEIAAVTRGIISGISTALNVFRR